MFGKKETPPENTHTLSNYNLPEVDGLRKVLIENIRDQPDILQCFIGDGTHDFSAVGKPFQTRQRIIGG